jgi:hypothetical protein
MNSYCTQKSIVNRSLDRDDRLYMEFDVTLLIRQEE